MKRGFFWLLVLTVNGACAQSVSKEEKKRLKQELHSYLNDIESYQVKINDMKSASAASEAEIKLLKDEMLFCTSKQSELQKKLAVADSITMSLQQELAIMRGDPVTTTVNRSNKPRKTSSVSEAGTVFKVQIGVYKKFNIVEYFEEPRCIGYDEKNGVTKYSIGYFTNEKMAREFMRDIRKMGIRDAFVTKYVDGKRDYSWRPGMR